MSDELEFFIHYEAPFPYKLKFVVENGNLDVKIRYDVEKEFIGSWLEPKWFRNMKIELLNYLMDKNEDKRKLKKCRECKKFYISKSLSSKYCSDKCRMAYHNRKRIKSGEHARYKRERRASGLATPSYFGPDPDKGKRKTAGKRK
jgi:hypothetical protein